MKTAVLFAAVLGLAVATPTPVQPRQDLDPDSYFDAVGDALPTVVAPIGDASPEFEADYDDDAADAVAAAAGAAFTAAPAATAAAVAVPDLTDDSSVVVDIEKRVVAACTTRTFNGPRVTTPADSPSAFLNYAPFHASAQAAAHAAAIPKGWALITGFVDLYASVKGGDYLTYTSSSLTGYNLQQCADYCDDRVKGCNAFNIFYERVPLIIDPATHTTNKDTCPGLTTSPSATLIKCDFYGKAFTPTQATNTGQSEQDFKFVKAGSNGYVRSEYPTVDGYDGPTSLGNAAISVPAPVGAHGFIRVQTFGTNVPYDPSLCGKACTDSANYNIKNGKAPCVFFDAFVQYLNGVNGVLTCNLYSLAYGPSFATNVGRHDNSGNHWTIGMSNTYTLTGYTGGTIEQ